MCIRDRYYPFPLVFTVGEQIAKYANIVRYGPPSGSRESGNIDREGSEGTSLQSGSHEPSGSSGFLRTQLRGVPFGLQPGPEPQADADSCTGLETIVGVALNPFQTETAPGCRKGSCDMQLEMTRRLLGSSAIVSQEKGARDIHVTLDVEGLVRRLLLFDTYILYSVRA